MNTVDTKSKILNVAQDLFAEKGFDGASIRDIAQRADVNIAAVNYHFKNKENLYWSVFIGAHEMLEDELQALSNKCSSLKEMMWQAFLFLEENSAALRSAFLIMLSDSFPSIDPERYEELMGKKKEFGPPGGKYVFDFLSKEAGSGVNRELLEWGVQVLFTELVHWVLLKSGAHCNQLYKDHPHMANEWRKKSVEMHIEAVILYLKSEASKN